MLIGIKFLKKILSFFTTLIGTKSATYMRGEWKSIKIWSSTKFRNGQNGATRSRKKGPNRHSEFGRLRYPVWGRSVKQEGLKRHFFVSGPKIHWCSFLQYLDANSVESGRQTFLRQSWEQDPRGRDQQTPGQGPDNSGKTGPKISHFTENSRRISPLEPSLVELTWKTAVSTAGPLQ